jgi:hypothetical protein
MNPFKPPTILLMLAALAAASFISCSPSMKENAEVKKEKTQEELIAMGEHIVSAGGCQDCHSPKVFSAEGVPMPDETKKLSGHPAGSPLPPIDTNALRPGYWIMASPDLTAWIGPWGISYAMNLTPDSVTGIGTWTAENFVKAIRTGKHLGLEGGRPILPPMP